MNPKLERLQLLKSTLASVSAGRGVSASVVLSLRVGRANDRLAARMVLLGHPPKTSMKALVTDESRELGMLASLVTMAASSNAIALSRRGSQLAALLESWLKAKEERAMEARVFQMRGLIMSAVLGALLATVSALGPLITSSGIFSAGTGASGVALNAAAAGMVAVSSTMLGLFLSGRRFYLNLALGLGVFLVALSATSPLASVPVVSPWGAK